MRLDAKINECSYKLADAVKKGNKSNEIQKSIGVLANNGVYAFYIFCQYKKIWNIVDSSLQELNNYLPGNPTILDNKFFTALDDDISNLFFVKEILEKLLTYTRYHINVLEESNG